MLRKIRRKCFVVLMSLVMVISLMPAITLTASAGTENIIYVNSNTGNDETGDGTSSNPYKTFTKGYSMVNYWGTLDLTGTFTWTDAAETGDAAEDGFQIAKSITIKGQGADETIIQAAASSGAAISRLFRFTDGLNVTFQDLEMRYGKTYKCGGGLYISTNYYNPSSVAILNCYIHDNSSGRSDVHESGGGIMLEGSVNLSIVNSTISNNLAYGDGGGICQNLYSSLTLTNSTICNNSGYRGGGIITWHATNGTSITNCTIAGNLAANYGGGIKQSGGNFYIKNNIIADNNATNDYGSKDYDYWSGSVVDNGNNIIEYYGAYNHPTAPLSGTTITGDQPNLKLSSSTPASNGTFTGTPTLALSSGSVAINAGNSAANGSISIPSADQRGLVRNGAVDIGAYEYGGIVPSAPTVSTDPATDLTITGATLNGSVDANNGSTEVTFEYGTTASYGSSVTASQSPVSGDSAASVSCTLSGLTPNTTYHYRVTGENVAGTANGADRTFTTLAVPPTVTTNAVTSATSTGAILNGSVNANNTSTEVTFEYGTTTSYGISAAAIQSPVTGVSTTPVSHTLTGLMPNTTYHYRVVGENTAGITNGLDRTFTTSVPPTAITNPVTSITSTGAILNGSVNANNASTAVTFEYGETVSYGSSETASQSPASGIGETSVSYALTGLTPNTTYHYRVAGVNAAGTTNGLDETFTTLTVPPTVNTNPVTSATSTGAILNGSVNANNASTEVIFEYGTTTSYGTSAAAIESPVNGTSVTSVRYALTALTPNTTYHYRVVGVNTAGTTNGLDGTFTTSVTPTVITNPVTSITSTGAILNGSVNSNNADTAVIFEYGTTTSYSTSAAAIESPVNGMSETTVSYAVTGLTPNTTYHYRVIGVNTAGTTNGLDGTFTTSSVQPTVTNNPVTNVSTTGAILNGTVNANNASTVVIFEYGTTTSYGTSVSAIESPVTGTSATPVSDALTGLTPNTTYHYRVVGVNSAGTTNGLDGTFTTSRLSGGGGSSSGKPTEEPRSDTTNGTTTVTTEITATTVAGGKAAASVTGDQITNAVAKASAAAQSANSESNVEIDVAANSGVTNLSLTVPQAAFRSLTDNNIDLLTIESPIATVSFDGTAIAAIGNAAGANVVITVAEADTSSLSEAKRAEIGNRPVYDLTITSGNSTISSFNGGTATVSVPYTPASGEDGSQIVIYYLTDSGELVMVPNCVYDAVTGKVTFTTTHFSSYVVGYNAVSFLDISGWYKEYVNYLAARDILNGTGGDNFSPNSNITRAQLVTILANLSGDDLTSYTASSFRDVKTSAWYFSAAEWAFKNGIATGSNDMFKPNDFVTRQDIAVMIARYAEKVAKYDLPKTNVKVTFTDSNRIASYSAEAITSIQQAGIISGGSDGSFAPTANATRAQTAKMIALLVQNMTR